MFFVITDNNQDMIGAAVGVVGCAVLTAVIAAFVINKRRTSTFFSKLPIGKGCTW